MTFLSEYFGVILFYSVIGLLIYLNRNKLEKQAALIYLLKTKVGLKWMDKWAKKLNKFVKFMGYVGIVVAYLGFFIISFALIKSSYDIIINKPGAVGGSPVIPGLPIAGLGIKFPLIIGWISLFIIMVVHEFSHGIVARAHKVKVNSSGIAFFGPILGAFVEPNEKELRKQPHKIQHSVFAAGPFSNVLLWILCLGLIAGVSSIALGMTTSDGVKIGVMEENLPAFNAGMEDETIIIAIDDYKVTDIDSLSYAIDKISPQQEVVLYTDKGNYIMNTTNNPSNESQPYLGIWIYQENRVLINDSFLNDVIFKVLLWFLELFQWTAFISINIGLINLFPIFITDGAQMLKLNFEKFIKDKKKAFEYWKSVNVFALFIIFIMLFLPLLRNIFNAIVAFLI